MSAFSREIRSFIVVSQSASIRAAAGLLNMSAPALSRQMQILERSYGKKLLVRSANGVALTTEGEALRNEAMRWMEADAALSQRLHHDKKSSGLHIRMGVMEGLVPTLVPCLSDHLTAIYGRVDLELVVGTTRDIIDRAEAFELDIIVAFNMPRLSRLAMIQSEEYHLGVVFAPGFGPDGEGPVSLVDVLQYPLCLPSAALSMHTRLLAEILSVRINPHVSFSSNSVNALLAFIKRGNGIGFLTWLDVCKDVEAGNLIFRSLANKRLTETLSISVCSGNSLAYETGAVVREIQAILNDLGK